MAIVNPDIDVCIQEYKDDKTVYDFVGSPWLGQVMTSGNHQGLIDIVWFNKNVDGSWVKCKLDGRRLFRSSVHQDTLIIHNFDLEDGKIPETVMNSAIGQLHDIQNKYNQILSQL